MSALREKIERVFGRPAAKVETPPVAPPALATPPAFLSANILSTTTEFLLVFGDYNFAVAKSFAQPVIGLLNDWVPAYAEIPPFAGMKRCEIIISRVVPEPSSGATEVNPDATKAAAKSADLDTNVQRLLSLARHVWIRERAIFSNAGVARCAQERFEARHFRQHREKYLKRFVKMSDVRTRDIAALCTPPLPARPLNPPVLRPARHVCKNQAQWDALPELERARMLAEEESQWLHQYAPAWGNSRRKSDIIVTAPEPSFDEITSCEGWKQLPNQSERESIERDDWK